MCGFSGTNDTRWLLPFAVETQRAVRAATLATDADNIATLLTPGKAAVLLLAAPDNAGADAPALALGSGGDGGGGGGLGGDGDEEGSAAASQDSDCQINGSTGGAAAAAGAAGGGGFSGGDEGFVAKAEVDVEMDEGEVIAEGGGNDGNDGVLQREHIDLEADVDVAQGAPEAVAEGVLAANNGGGGGGNSEVAGGPEGGP